MDLDALLRRHQGETVTKTLQLERNLAQRQADLRQQTQEMEDLSQKYVKACKVSEERVVTICISVIPLYI